LLYGVIPDEKFEEMVEAVKKAADKGLSVVRKQKTYKIHESSLPFEGCAVTEGRKAVKKMFDDRCATDLIYR